MKKLSDKNICIIGGGITGLVLAYYLSKDGFKVTILEKSSELGGLLKTIETSKGVKIEKFYHHIFKTDKHLLELIEELDLTKNLYWHESSTSLYKGKRFYSFSTPNDLLKLPILSVSSRVRLGVATLFLSKLNSIKHKNISAKNIIQKYMGKEAWETLWNPLFKGKFDDYSDDIGAPWFIERLKGRSTKREEGKEYLGYLNGSFQILLDSLIKKLEKTEVEILTNQNIEKIEYNNNELSIDDNHFDIVISTISPNSFKKISPLKDNRKIDYIGAICTLLELKKGQTKYYWSNLLDPDIPFKGLIEHTNLINKQKYGGNSLIYLSQYTKSDSKYFKMSSEELKKEYLKHLEKIVPGILSDIIDIKIFKTREAQPVVPLKFKPLKNETSIPNLFTTSMAHIYPEDRGMNNAVREAKKVRNLIYNSRIEKNKS